MRLTVKRKECMFPSFPSRGPGLGTDFDSSIRY